MIRLRNSTVGWIRAAVLVLLLVCGSRCQAQPRLLTAQVESSSQSSRTHGPIAVVWRLRSESTGLIRGNLIATVFDGDGVVMRVTTDELALTTGEQSFRMVLPAIDSSHGGNFTGLSGVRVSLRFAGPDLKVNLGEFPLRVSDQWERTLSVAVCDPWQTQITAELQQFVAALRIETHCSIDKDQSVATVPCHYRPRDLGTEPLSYCAFNILLLAREGLAELRPEQLDAISDWVNGGGALCVVPDNIPLSRDHVEFLDRLAGGTAGREPLIPDSAGRLTLAGTPPRLVSYGLGRVALLPGTRDQPVSGVEDLRRAIAFLWRMRRDRSDAFIATGKWGLPAAATPTATTNGVAWDRDYFKQVRSQRNRGLVPAPLQSADQLLEKLIPRTMRLLPLPLVGLILAGYVLLIGPVDYIGLGFLKQRKWTWVLFPAVTIAVTLATVKLSHWFMGNTDTPKRVVVADVGGKGLVARTSEYRLKVSGTERTFETEVVGGLFNVIEYRRFGSGGWYNHIVNVQQGRDDDNRGSDSPMMFGRIPSQYTVRQFLPQWSPRLNRVFRIARHQAAASAGVGSGGGEGEMAGRYGLIEPLEFDFSQFESAGLDGVGAFVEPETQGRLRDAVARIPGLAGAYLARGSRLTPLAGPMVGRVFTLGDFANTQPRMYVPGTVGGQQPDEFLTNICVNANDGLFEVLSQLAPHGGADFEDLPLIDAGDPRQWMLVICVERGEDLIVWRKLYGGDN